MRVPRRPAQTTEAEWMDAPGHPPDLIDDNLNDLRRVNRWLGGVRLTRLALERLVASLSPTEPVRVLDVASGAADIPLALTRWAARRGRLAWFVASDMNLDIVQVARAHQPVPPNLVFVVADATRLPFLDDSFHVVTSSLSLHHLFSPEAIQMFREVGRCASVGVVVNDVVRSWLAYFGSIVATRLGSHNPLTHHDGPVSVLRAFTVREMRAMARLAGLRPVEWHSFLFYRVALLALPPAAAA